MKVRLQFFYIPGQTFGIRCSDWLMSYELIGFVPFRVKDVPLLEMWAC
jgi:hypothetical protein